MKVKSIDIRKGKTIWVRTFGLKRGRLRWTQVIFLGFDYNTQTVCLKPLNDTIGTFKWDGNSFVNSYLSLSIPFYSENHLISPEIRG